MKYVCFIVVVVLLGGCTKENMTDTTPNILLIIADDMGKDATAGFTEGTIKPNTANLDKIRTEGLSFTNFWSYPTCSPTRASIITGKYGYRTGVKWAGDELATTEQVLQDYINEQTNDAYATAIIGKWHLAGDMQNVNPEDLGIDYYTGLIRGGVQDNYDWRITENGASSLRTQYTTEVFTDLSINWVNSQTKPWFLWLAYNTPHTPFHVPPSEMHSQGNLQSYTDGLDPMPYYMAAIEAMDFQIGRLLDSMTEEERNNTIIIFIGDNGTPNQVAQSPYGSGIVKGSLYQGGINVPLFVSGAGVSRTGEDDNLITSTDIFSTIAALAGVDNSAIYDSKSFKSLFTSEGEHRDFQYAEMNNGNDDLWAISNGTYKLIVNANGQEELYDLTDDPYENNDLLTGTLTSSQADAKAELEQELGEIRE